MKKILIVSAVFPPEQLTSSLMNYDLAVELAKSYSVTVLRPKPTRPIGTVYQSADVDDHSFETVMVNSYTHPQSQLIGRMRESVSFGKRAAEYIEAHHEDIDFIYNGGWQLFGYFLIARAAKKYGIPYMVPIQDIYPESLLTKANYPLFVKKLVKQLLLPFDKYYQRNAACIRTISDEMRDYLSTTRGIAKEQFLIVNNWQNDGDFSTLPNTPLLKKMVFAYVGSINVHANVDMMIRAFKEAKIPNSELRIYGGGNQKDTCLHLVAELGLNNVSFDFVSRDQIPGIQAEADILMLALPTGNGNLCLPSKLTSYLLSGKPVLASVDKGSATQRFIETARCGLVVEPDSIESFAKGMVTFSNMREEEVKKMGEKSRTFALRYLTKEVNLAKVVSKIKEIAG